MTQKRPRKTTQPANHAKGKGVNLHQKEGKEEERYADPTMTAHVGGFYLNVAIIYIVAWIQFMSQKMIGGKIHANAKTLTHIARSSQSETLGALAKCSISSAMDMRMYTFG